MRGEARTEWPVRGIADPQDSWGEEAPGVESRASAGGVSVAGAAVSTEATPRFLPEAWRRATGRLYSFQRVPCFAAGSAGFSDCLPLVQVKLGAS